MQEVSAFLQWCSNLRGRFHEATYDDKHTALRMLGVQVRIWKKDDPDNPRWRVELNPEILTRLAGLSPIIEDEAAPEADPSDLWH